MTSPADTDTERERDQRDPEEEHPALAEELAQPRGEEHGAAGSEKIGVHDSDQRVVGNAEVAADGQRLVEQP